MKRLGKILLSLFVALLLLITVIAAVDRSRFDRGEKPLFARPFSGGDCVEYIGIGYSVLYLYPEVSRDDPAPDPAPQWSWFWET